MNKITMSTPWEIIEQEFLIPYNVSVTTFSTDLGISKEELNNLMTTKLDISLDFAKKLADYFGTSYEFWINIQKEYNSRINK